MGITKIQATTIQPTTTNNTARNRAIAATSGALAGSVGAFVLPSKDELGKAFSKESVDSFVSASAARAKNRSVLAYAGVGALAAVGLNQLFKAMFPKKEEKKDIQYTKLNALIDASADACMITWYDSDIK